jgi:uncharacterized membrane protein HdeD (DUF308 family)
MGRPALPSCDLWPCPENAADCQHVTKPRVNEALAGAGGPGPEGSAAAAHAVGDWGLEAGLPPAVPLLPAPESLAPESLEEASAMSVDPQTTRDRGDELGSEARAGLWRMAGPWWLLLLTGIAWLIISVVVLRFTATSAATVGVLLGVVFLAAMANEFFIAYVRLGWRWAHVLMGIVFLAAAIWAFARPVNAFWALASAVGLLLVLQGGFVLITSIESRVINPVWWLGMVAGILEVFAGFWASQQLVTVRAALLIIWVGLLALFNGINQIVLAFELKSAQHR